MIGFYIILSVGLEITPLTYSLIQVDEMSIFFNTVSNEVSPQFSIRLITLSFTRSLLWFTSPITMLCPQGETSDASKRSRINIITGKEGRMY